ncbi:hypothetical protein Ciccas_006738 [Cichlidogyrus casuarinus]|uniref:Uncharacterized protein n=1 Tax=Cichlidogyrus casuarinus TaxID=1844966 RepID=A0ABD2Q5E0_9PLAT
MKFQVALIVIVAFLAIAQMQVAEAWAGRVKCQTGCFEKFHVKCKDSCPFTKSRSNDCKKACEQKLISCNVNDCKVSERSD